MIEVWQKVKGWFMPVFMKSLQPLKNGISQVKTPVVQVDIAQRKSIQDEKITEFWFKPDCSIKLSEVKIVIGNITDTILPRIQFIYEKNKWYQLVGLPCVEAGQEWLFVFIGTTAAQGLPFQIVTKSIS